jgi:hypothetical protein
MVPLPHFHYTQPDPAGLTRRAVSIPALPSAAWVRRVVAGGGCLNYGSEDHGRHLAVHADSSSWACNSSALRWPQRTVLGMNRKCLSLERGRVA